MTRYVVDIVDDEENVLSHQEFKSQATAHSYAANSIMRLLKKHFQIVPAGIDMTCILHNTRTGQSIAISFMEEEL